MCFREFAGERRLVSGRRGTLEGKESEDAVTAVVSMGRRGLL